MTDKPRHHQFGTIAGDEKTGGILNVVESVVLQQISVCAVGELPNHPDMMKFIALQLAGFVVGTKETVQTVWIVPVSDAGVMCSALLSGVEQLHDEEALMHFKMGQRMTSLTNLEPKNNDDPDPGT